MADPLPLVTDLLYRLGTEVPAENLSWLPAGSAGFEPLNCYVFLAGDEAIFIDAGAAISQPAISAGLADLVLDRARSVFVTRCEGENIGNLAEVTGRDTRLLFGGGGGVLEWIHRPRLGHDGEENLVGAVPIVPANNGMTYRSPTGLCFHWMDAPIKQMFLTQWAYEEQTATLFTSDLFGWHHLAQPFEVPVVDHPDAIPAPAVVAEEISCRVNWLRGARFSERIDLLQQVFDTYRVERIAPVHGSVIVGAETVERTLEVTLEALGSLQASA
jgi:hypothetical protein